MLRRPLQSTRQIVLVHALSRAVARIGWRQPAFGGRPLSATNSRSLVSAILPVVELTTNRGATAPCADDSFQVLAL